VPIISADIADFRQMAQGEELAIEFYPPGDAQGLADCLADFLHNTEKQHRMAVQNFSAGLRMTMPNVVQKYIRHFELQQRVQTLRYVSRFRRLPRWIPSKSLLLRLMTRNSLGWARRSTMIHTPWNGHADPELFNGNGNGSSGLNGSGNPIDRDSVSTQGRTGDYGFHAVPAARHAADQQPQQDDASERDQHLSAPSFADEGYAKQSEAEQSGGEKEASTFSPVRGHRDDGFESEHGTDGAGARSNGRRGERTG
jgi:hypothetical protein